MHHFKFFLGLLIFSTLLMFSSNAFTQSMQPPVRIGGTVTIDGEQIHQGNGTDLRFEVTKPGVAPLNPQAVDADGLNAHDYYLIDIPVFDKNKQPHGAQPGELLQVHVLNNGNKLNVTSPVNGTIQMGKSGSIIKIDIQAKSF